MSNVLAYLVEDGRSSEDMERKFQKQLALARSSSEADLLKLASCYGLDGCSVIHGELRRNPAITLKVAEAALRELQRFNSCGWDPCGPEDQRAWEKRFAELVADDPDATLEDCLRAYEYAYDPYYSEESVALRQKLDRRFGEAVTTE